MCSRVGVVEKFAAFIIVVDEMIEAAGFSETWVNFCPIRGVTSQKSMLQHVQLFFLKSTLTRDETRASLFYA
jgi:hypothetical protein